VSQLLQLFNPADVDLAWLAKLVSLFFLPGADEDFAIILGGYFVVNKLMPLGLVMATIYVGMVASDFAMYGIGVAAHHIPWLNRVESTSRSRTSPMPDAQPLRAGRAVPRRAGHRSHCLHCVRLDARAAEPLSHRKSGDLRALLAADAVPGGDVRRCARRHAGLWTWPFLLAVVASSASCAIASSRCRRRRPPRLRRAVSSRERIAGFGPIARAHTPCWPLSRLHLRKQRVAPRAPRRFKSR